MKLKIEFSQEKNLLLKETRGVGFEDVIEAIFNGNLLDDIAHFNQEKYPIQRIFIVRIKTVIYAVPYVIDKKREVIFLKTIYPSRKLKKEYYK